MREISTEKIKVGENVIIDGVEYVAEEHDLNCSECVFFNSEVCSSIPCDDVILKKVKKEPEYRPYKDTEEMIADYKERFKVDKVPSFCMPLIWVKDKNDAFTHISLITAFTGVSIGSAGVFRSMDLLFDRYTYLDGSPCGKETD